MAGQREGKRIHRRERFRLTRGQKGLIAVAAVLAVALAGVLAWQSLFVRPELPGSDSEGDGGTGSEEIDWGEGIRPRSDGERKSEDYWTVLVLGRDTGGGGNTDTMLLASYDVTNQKAAVMSIPRDTMVNVSWDVKKINSVYNASGGGEKGIQALYQEIAQLVGFAPDFQVVIEWEGVGAIVDAIGGVWFDVPYFMEYDDPLQDLHIYQPDGYRLLSGEDAMQVIRWRENNNSSTHGYRRADGGIGDSGRMKIQQDFLKALIQQVLRPENILNIREILSVFRENVETDLSLRNLAWFARQAVDGGFSTEDVEFFTMPWTSGNVYSSYYSRRNGAYRTLNYVFPVADELLELVNTKLSPYTEVFTLADLDVMTLNSDGSVSSSTGHVEDSNLTHSRAYWQAQWAPEEPAPESETAGAAAPANNPQESGGGTAGSGTGTPAPETGGGTADSPPSDTETETGTQAPDTGGTGTADPGAGAESPQPSGDNGGSAAAPDAGFVIVS